MISSEFPKSFRGAGDLVVLSEYLKKSEKDPRNHKKKIVKHQQVISTPKTLRKLAWNQPTMFWLHSEKNRSFLEKGSYFCTGQPLAIRQQQKSDLDSQFSENSTAKIPIFEFRIKVCWMWPYQTIQKVIRLAWTWSMTKSLTCFWPVKRGQPRGKFPPHNRKHSPLLPTVRQMMSNRLGW